MTFYPTKVAVQSTNDDAPYLPMNPMVPEEVHRDKLDDSFDPWTFSLVARLRKHKEVACIPVARKALQAEWGKLKNMKHWLVETVQGYDPRRRRTVAPCTSGESFRFAMRKDRSCLLSSESTKVESSFRAIR